MISTRSTFYYYYYGRGVRGAYRRIVLGYQVYAVLLCPGSKSSVWMMVPHSNAVVVVLLCW